MQPPYTPTSPQHRKRNTRTIKEIPNESKNSTLVWPMSVQSTASVSVPVQVEMNILPVLARWGHTERGMMLSQPSFRLPMIRNACRKNNIQLIQALSLRRTYIKYLNPYKSMEALGLGLTSQIRQSATLFEQAVATFLTQQGLQFYTEEDQKELFFQEQQQESFDTVKTDSTIHGDTDNNNIETTDTNIQSQRILLTPDFIFNPPIKLCKHYSKHGTHHQDHQHSTHLHHHHHNQHTTSHIIHWLEAKMFYGASTIPQGTNNAVGEIIEKVTKYMNHFGPGAIVFAYGCGEELKREIENRNIQVLDSYPLDLSHLHDYQKTWCCNDQGEVLF